VSRRRIVMTAVARSMAAREVVDIRFLSVGEGAGRRIGLFVCGVGRWR